MVKNLPASAGYASSIPESRISHGGGNGNLLQYSRLGNLMDRRAWRATVNGVAKRVEHNCATKQHIYTYMYMVVQLLSHVQLF